MKLTAIIFSWRIQLARSCLVTLKMASKAKKTVEESTTSTELLETMTRLLESQARMLQQQDEERERIREE